jgi:sorbitol-specific phosphotransferase system component IIBC
VLIFAETEERVFVSADIRTMGRHLANHFASGRHTWGVVLLKPEYPIAAYINDLLLIWHATTQDEWLDQTVYIPY